MLKLKVKYSLFGAENIVNKKFKNLCTNIVEYAIIDIIMGLLYSFPERKMH